MLKQNKKCSSKSNSYLLKTEKRSESHLLFERKNHKYKKQGIRNKIKK